MQTYRVDFEKLPWIQAGEGIRFKCFEHCKRKIRLMELGETYRDNDWCVSGHASYILEGKFTVKFEERTEVFSAGDTVYIPAGTKHIAMVEEGNSLKMLSFEL